MLTMYAPTERDRIAGYELARKTAMGTGEEITIHAHRRVAGVEHLDQTGALACNPLCRIYAPSGEYTTVALTPPPADARAMPDSGVRGAHAAVVFIDDAIPRDPPPPEVVDG